MGRSSQQKGKDHEKTLRGRKHAASGSLWHDASDSDERMEGWMIGGIRYEGKQTAARSFRLTLKGWEKIKSEADPEGQEPVMVLDIDGTVLVVLSKIFFDALLLSDVELTNLLEDMRDAAQSHRS